MTTNALPPLTLLELADPGLPGFESYSPFCIKAHRALKYAGLPYARACADNPASHRAHNPTGQVPVLLVGAEAVPDSTAILARIQQLAPGRIEPHRRRCSGRSWRTRPSTASWSRRAGRMTATGPGPAPRSSTSCRRRCARWSRR
ncbi:glutathione S-transferase N-terminal domain-containing protein [Corallococcus sp. 4LFB]|uniref:glutathione S-transferase N-terminal domain-containing protein n=1 Tax=Corallococcus sp. 4LFB TaxID=3383249 RepID=UPI0039772432